MFFVLLFKKIRNKFTWKLEANFTRAKDKDLQPGRLQFLATSIGKQKGDWGVSEGGRGNVI